MSHRRAPRHAAIRGRRRILRHPDPVVQACACTCSAPATATELQPALAAPAATTFGEALLGAPEPWRPTALGPLGSDFMAQRPPVRELADVGAARVVSFRPSHTSPALAVDDPIRVKVGVPHHGGQYGTVFGFNCAADWSIGCRMASGELVFFAPDEVDRAPVAETLVTDDLFEDLVLMGGAR